jgi:serine/threonine protein phosphatase 1
MRRTLIIGDIHGCYAELLELFDRAALGADDLVVSVGDLVDRGPQPAEVVRWFRDRAGAVVLMGNHERKHVRGVFSYAQEITRLQLAGDYDDAVRWMGSLPYSYENEAVRVVHAALVPGRPLAEQPEEILCGSTSGEAMLRAAVPEGWWHETYDDPKPVVFGHHVVGPEPLVREGRVYGIDTGACHGMALTALSVPDFRLHSVAARADHWAAAKRAWQVPVLRARPWATMIWADIDQAIADRSRHANADVIAYLDAVRAWSAEVAALTPTLLSRVATLVEQLRAEHGEAGFAAAATAHPAKPLLFQHARGRLDQAAIAPRCTTPARTLDLAASLGLDVAALTRGPAPSSRPARPLAARPSTMLPSDRCR